MTQIKVAIAGVGNLASGFIQGIQYYTNHSEEKIAHPRLGGYEIKDIEVVAAFDIDERKVGKDLSEAIFANPNKMPKIMDVPELGVLVKKTPVLDGVAETAEEVIKISSEKEVDLAAELKSSGAEMLIIATPSGAVKTCEAFAKAGLDAGIGVINATPTPIARDPKWAREFRLAKLPLLGDDLQSQAGGTAFHKGLLKLLNEIGVRIKDTYQLDVSGGLEGLTTLDFERRNYKRSVKEHSIRQSLDYDFEVAAGTTDYLEFLGSTRIGYYWVEGKGFLGETVKLDIQLETVDGSNGAATLSDAVRVMKIALNKVATGPLVSPAPYLFKAPPVVMPLEKTPEAFEDFITGKVLL